MHRYENVQGNNSIKKEQENLEKIMILHLMIYYTLKCYFHFSPVS